MGMFCSLSRACLQTHPAWCIARLACCRSAHWLKGIMHLSYEESCLLAQFSLRQPHFLVRWLSVQRASRSMLMESRMVSSGSLATAGIVFYHIPRKDHAMCGAEGALIKELSCSKLIGNGMDGNRLRVFARPELRKNVRALPVKLQHDLHLHRLPPRVASLIEDGTTTHIVR